MWNAARFVRAAWYGAEGDRTPDPLLAKQVLSQLSYRPVRDNILTSTTAWEMV